MKNYLIFLFLAFASSCVEPAQTSEVHSIHKKRHEKLKDNLFVNPISGELYFSYEIPVRVIKGGEDQGNSRIIYDSIVMLDGDLVRIKTIIDTATYAIDADHENYQDKKYRYEMRYQNVIPKFKAIQRF